MSTALRLVLSALILHAASAGVPTCKKFPVCPFDDLSADEIRTTLRIAGQFPAALAGDAAAVRYPIVRALEPNKADWLSGSPEGHQRRALVTMFDLTSNLLSEVVVDLGTEQITSARQFPDGTTPPVMDIEYKEAEELIRSNIEWQDAVRRRGVEPEDARLNIWASGPVPIGGEGGGGKRTVRAVTNYQDPKSRFWYWAVLEGLIVNVDLHLRLVTSVWDDQPEGGAGNWSITSGIEELPDFGSKPPLKPLHISQPEGSSILVEGQRLEWYKWSLRYSVDPIFGLQLFHVVYDGDCERRSVLYKISMAEMFVPYGAGGRGWVWRSAFDAGEYGIGKRANPLKIGVDVPENAVLLDCALAGDSPGAEVATVQGCVAAYERDTGMLYKHTDRETGDVDGRRGRALVLTMMATIGNYDYTFDYVFEMDGSIQVGSRLTGIVLAQGVAAPDPPEVPAVGGCIQNCSNLLNDYLIGPPHQHFFNYRIDFDIDGQANHFVQVDLTPDEADEGGGGVFSAKKTLVPVEGHHDHNLQAHRSWHVVNSNSRNAHGSPRGYALRPESLAFTYFTRASPLLAHAQFVQHPVWVTRYKDEEQTPAARYPRSGAPGQGLPMYISSTPEPGAAESVVDEDLVVWYTFGVTHSTRPEEWPIMNVHNVVGFRLVPFNFLSQNSEMALKGKCP